MKHILGYIPSDLHRALVEYSNKPYQIQQILDWIYQKHTIDFQQMTNLSKTQRDIYSQKFDISLPEIVNIAVSTDDSKKYVLKLHDGAIVEMVTIPTAKKVTLCISTQVGCARGCAFCATADIGFVAMLTHIAKLSLQ